MEIAKFGEREGEKKNYHNNGKLDAEKRLEIIKMEIEGEVKSYHKMESCGQLEIIKMESEKENGQTIIKWKARKIGNYKNGKLEGEWKVYHNNGKLKGIGNYKNGKLEGEGNRAIMKMES